ncbi:hypothetical protein [Coraliomargarita sinensis]|uniref:hypothetical protein n=1 Tax=Coraliomargarita sinensis TaxID=2174842 RepID=UPI0018EE5A15|nr:hypothetical protein [Coraliomargarita sinensis]
MNWFKLVSLTGSTQLVVQAIGFICGILVVRLLPSSEYAYYTLANTMLGTMTLLADGGIANGVMAQGGKVWKDKMRLGTVLSTGIVLRKKFAVFSLLVATPVLLWLLRTNDASWLMSVMITLSVIPAFISALTGKIIRIGPKLNQDILPLQKITVLQNSGRLFLTAIFVFAFPFAGIAILATGISEVYANYRLRRISHKYADFSQKEDPEVRSKILNTVKRIMPGAVYYSISSQITIWVISIFGSTQALAEVGALTRLGMVLTVFSITFSTLITPRFARFPFAPKILIRYFLGIQLALILLAYAIVTTVWLFPAQVLWILGEGYAGLTSEVVLMSAGYAFGLVGGCMSQLCSSRGYLFKGYIMVGFGVLQNAMILLVDYASLEGILLYSLLVSLTSIVYTNAQFLFKLKDNGS